MRNSVLSNVRCRHIEAEGCVLINVTADRIVARPGSIIYNYVHHLEEVLEVEEEVAETPSKRARRDSNSSADKEEKEVRASPKDVIVGVFGEDGRQTVINSNVDTDGGEL